MKTSLPFIVCVVMLLGMLPVRTQNRVAQRKLGEVVIPLQYDAAYNFSAGFAVVRWDNQWGVIDKTGKVVIPLLYDWTGSFTEGCAPVARDDKWGFIDTTGKVVVPLQYDEAYSFTDGLAAVRSEGNWGYIAHGPQ